VCNIDIESINLFHIVHVDKLPIILGSGTSGRLVCDSEVQELLLGGTAIGMNKIKERRMRELSLCSYPNLYVGDCVPFYFCPRSIMLYMFYKNDHHEISYSGGQEPIVHLVFNMKHVIEWAEKNRRRWVFTDSNAGSYYFNDYNNLNDIDKLNWNAINARYWSNCKEEKQAEFLVEKSLPWNLVKEITVCSRKYYDIVYDILSQAEYRPPITIQSEWYY
jgi:hypothetical protein